MPQRCASQRSGGKSSAGQHPTGWAGNSFGMGTSDLYPYQYEMYDGNGHWHTVQARHRHIKWLWCAEPIFAGADSITHPPTSRHMYAPRADKCGVCRMWLPAIGTTPHVGRCPCNTLTTAVLSSSGPYPNRLRPTVSTCNGHAHRVA